MLVPLVAVLDLEGIEILVLDVFELDVNAERGSTGGSGGCVGTAGLGARCINA